MTLFELLSNNPALFVSGCFVLGLLIGSFLNVVIYRVPVMLQREWKQQCEEFLAEDEAEITVEAASNTASTPELAATSPLAENPVRIETVSEEKTSDTFNLLKPDSHCPNCNHKIRAWENIPVISYIFLGAKCSACKTRISPRYPVIELVTGALSALVAFHFPASWLTLMLLLLTWSLIVLTLIDFDHQLLPDNITLPLLWLGLIVNTLDLGFGVSLQEAVIGAIVGYLSLWSVYWAFKLITGKEGMGYGDFKLLAALGAWMGWQALLPTIILSSLVGAVVGGLMIIFMGRDKSVPIPFGPFLAGAGFIMLIWGPQILSTYLSVLA